MARALPAFRFAACGLPAIAASLPVTLKALRSREACRGHATTTIPEPEKKNGRRCGHRPLVLKFQNASEGCAITPPQRRPSA